MDITVLALGEDFAISQFVIATEIRGIVNIEQNVNFSHNKRTFNHYLRNKAEHRTNVLNRHGYFNEDSNIVNNSMASNDPSPISNTF